MNDRYKTWIDTFHSKGRAMLPTGLYSISKRSLTAAREMAGIFPELVLVEGEVRTSHSLEHHWWCENRETGEVVDPSAEQFSGPVTYRRFTDLL